jgi:hypothetical protein
MHDITVTLDEEGWALVGSLGRLQATRQHVMVRSR